VFTLFHVGQSGQLAAHRTSPPFRWLLAEGFPGGFSPASVRQAIAALVLLVVLALAACGGDSGKTIPQSVILSDTQERVEQEDISHRK